MASVALTAIAALAALAAVVWWLEAQAAPDAGAAALPWAASSSPSRLPDDMVRVPGGIYRLGASGGHAQADAPTREVLLEPFLLDRHEVTNRQFARFVAATGHRTTAEREGGGWVYRGGSDDWQYVAGASWRHPLGPDSSIEGAEEHPVVLVSWHDARAYAQWAGKRLPTEWEWEAAARAGGATVATAVADAGEGRVNVWQGTWPRANHLEDGFFYTAPVGSFPADELGLHDMIGNVWEWTGSLYAEGDERRVARGGSWFCSPDYCSAYRPDFRGKTPPGQALNNVGFRCARDLPTASRPPTGRRDAA